MSHNTWVHKGARVLMRPLVATPVTPDHLTALRLLTGLAAAGALAVGSEEWRVAGALLFILSFLLDRADGELARLSGKFSKVGHRFDLVADSTSNVLIFIGLGIGLREGPVGAWAVPMGLLAGGAVALVLWLVMRAEAAAGPRAGELPSFGGFDADDAMLAVPLAILFGASWGLLVAATIGAPAFAALFLVLTRLDLVGGGRPPG